MSAKLHLLKDGRAIDAVSGLSVGIWEDAPDCIKLFIPTSLEQVSHPKPATHKGVVAELNGAVLRYREEAVYNPALKRFTVKYIQI